jgi:hypothetical protein
MLQLEIYAALFCLNYQAVVRNLRKKGLSDNDIADRLKVGLNELHFDPAQMAGIELRIYQLGEVRVETPDPDKILDLMDIIISSDQIINELKAEG